MAFFDARKLDSNLTIDADICIVGGGAAGITLAREFAGQRPRVVLLESGGLEFARGPQSLYAGENVGLDNLATHQSRFRMFGGSTTRWGGQCRPLDPIDFERRAWVPNSGWPFDRAHLEPWYRRAQDICNLGAYAYDPHSWLEGGCQALPVDAVRLEARVFQYSHPSDFSRVYRRDLEAAGNVEVYLHANVVQIELNHDARRVTRLRLATLDGRRFRIRARVYVLAAGGIENARLLLASNRVIGAGVGNDYDLVGRYFMDHAYFWVGHFDPSDPIYRRGLHVNESFSRVEPHHRAHLAFCLPERTQREERLNGCAIYMVRRLAYKSSPEYFSAGGRSLVHLADVAKRVESADHRLPGHVRNVITGHRDVLRLLARQVRHLVAPQLRLALRAVLETTPRADSRVTLAAVRDRLGMRRVRVDWRIDSDDRRGLTRLRAVMRAEMERLSLGRIAGDVPADADGWPTSMVAGKHHMGTTRMDVCARRGVVDPDCRVHTVANLYVAGSSVFPTCGYANPTLTIVALALRLADHLKAQLRA